MNQANEPGARYVVVFTPAARRGLDKLPLPAAIALYEHLTGPVAGNPYRLSKPLDAPFDELRSARRGDYRALYRLFTIGGVEGLACRYRDRRRGLPRMGVPTLPIRKTSTCLTLPSRALT